MGEANKDPLKWGRYAAIAGAYAACYEVTRYFSYSHWMLTAGLRLACLLLVPRRFWPALAVGEMLPIAEMALLHARLFGVVWACLVSIPPIALSMPIVAFFRQRREVVHDDGRIGMGMILTLTLACALMTTLSNSVALLTVQMADGSPAPTVTVPIFLFWFMGNYLGALTLTPVIVAMRDRLATVAPGAMWTSVARSPLTRATVVGVVPVLVLMTWLGNTQTDGVQEVARMAMAIPVIAMTLRYGWHGGAVGGMLASIALAITGDSMQEPGMLQAQAVLAFAISTSLLFGVRIARSLAANRSAQIAAGHTAGR